MNELVNLVAQRPGLSQEDSQKAVVAVMDFLKTKLPAPIASHLDALMAGGTDATLRSLEAEAGELLKGKLGGLFGQSSYAVFTQQRSTSATLQACAMQPPAVCGSRASKTSLIVPIPFSFMLSGKRSRNFRAVAFSCGMHFQPRIDERSDEPRPDRALVIGAVSGAKVAAVDRFVIRMVRRERTKPDRGKQFALGDVDHRFPARLVQHRMVERDRKQLVRPAGRRRSRCRHPRPRRRKGGRLPRTKTARLNDSRVRSRLLRVTLRRIASRHSPRNQPSSSLSALNQSALSSTAFPRRGVTTQSPIFASIQVS